MKLHFSYFSPDPQDGGSDTVLDSNTDTSVDANSDTLSASNTEPLSESNPDTSGETNTGTLSGSNTDAENKTENQKDNSKLVLTPNDYPVYVSPDGGTTNEPFPVANVDYDFCTNVYNGSDQPSGSFFVQFTITGDDGSSNDFTFPQKAGLDPAASVLAVVHYGQFPDVFVDYTLTACIYSDSAPNTPINNCGTFDFPVNTTS